MNWLTAISQLSSASPGGARGEAKEADDDDDYDEDDDANIMRCAREFDRSLFKCWTLFSSANFLPLSSSSTRSSRPTQKLANLGAAEHV